MDVLHSKRDPQITRRVFLRALATGSAALALEPLLVACARSESLSITNQPDPQVASLTATQASLQVTATDKAVPPASVDLPGPQPPASVTPAGSDQLQPLAGSTVTPDPVQSGLDLADLVVVHGDVGQERELGLEMVRRLLAPLGGIEHFVAQGVDVVIKPNICTSYYPFEYAATTNPYIVAALVTLCIGAGARRVRVMDNPFGGTAQSAYKVSGIQEQVQAAGGEMVVMSPMKYIKTELPKGVDLKSWTVYEDVLNADVLIDVPILKHHSLARLTIGMKNLMGVTKDRSNLHRNLGQRIADLTSRVRPQLIVVDAMRALMANGPTGGSLNDVQEMGTLIASTDIVAADSYAARLMGVQPQDLAYLRAGSAMGLGRTDLDYLNIEEINI